MAEVKLVMMYPVPKDVEAFEKVYQNEHVPMAVENLVGKTKIVATKVLKSPHGKPAFYRIAEVCFPSPGFKRWQFIRSKKLSSSAIRKIGAPPVEICAAWARSLCLDRMRHTLRVPS